MTYQATVKEVYRDAARQPAANLCCVPLAPKYLPGLVVPDIMHEMNYGCGSTVHLQDMKANQTILYVGVGGGLELLELAYFSRRPGGVIGVDPVQEMRLAAARNLQLAAHANDWFESEFVDLRDGDALALPVADESVDFAAQNCLFNIFRDQDLDRALGEIHRVLRPQGRLMMSDPVTPRAIPAHLADDERMRAECLSGCRQLEDYLATMVRAGYGAIEVRSRRPYRLLDRQTYALESDLLLETVEVAAFKVPVPDDGPCIFTGRCAVYVGTDEAYDDGQGHILTRNLPLSVCDKTARKLESEPQILVTPSTWHYQGDGCC